MDLLFKSGRVMFAFGMFGLGILCLMLQDFIVGRPPGWNDGPAQNLFMEYVPGIFCVFTATAILLKWKTQWAAITLGLLIILFSLLKHLVVYNGDWLNALKTVALAGGCLIILASCRSTSDQSIYRDRLNSVLILVATAMLSAFFIGAGYAHFIFADFVQNFIPAYIPFRLFWAYFCGVCLIAGGIGILVPFTKRLASLLSGVMVLGWFLLLHIPRVVMNPNDLSDQLGLCESFAFAGVFFVLTQLQTKTSSEEVQLAKQ